MIHAQFGIQRIRNLGHPTFNKKRNSYISLENCYQTHFRPILYTEFKKKIQKDHRLFNDAPWSIKEAWLQKEIGKKVDPEDASIEATTRIANLNKSRIPTTNIYTDASSQTNGTTVCACFIKEKDKELSGRIRNHTLITLPELHAVKAALIWISRQYINERVIIHSNSMEAITIIAAANFHTYPEMITDIYITASIIRQRGIQVIFHCVPSHINLEGNDRADQLANEALYLEVIEHAEHTLGQSTI